MPTGVIINSAAIFLGGIFGGLWGHIIPQRLKIELNNIFGVCSMGMGISSIVLMKNMPAVILAVVLGTAIGILFHVGDGINRTGYYMQGIVSKLPFSSSQTLSDQEFMLNLVTVIVLFCASGTGIYGSLDSGISGDATILISKSILDFFSAAIFAANLGLVVSLIAVPQFIIFIALFLLAHIIVPLTTPSMIADFKACGGFLMIATGFRIIKVKMFPTADMIPAMLFVMPFSWFWTNIVTSFL
ncbi:DUF554 domain-containing protein [Streptococcus sciuri]|uniref:DUF554 domain-containing protein n=1 Tax=Streptococcus sciuri TaxID=2973939 RepID=A0ABT2F7R4_9STRE|nr:DUF554 domain-containing protein [Streptococcus sciuri]MCS4488449.1 DUF554 domain-containing protein [Streptococcus sciuri]